MAEAIVPAQSFASHLTDFFPLFVPLNSALPCDSPRLLNYSSPFSPLNTTPRFSPSHERTREMGVGEFLSVGLRLHTRTHTHNVRRILKRQRAPTPHPALLFHKRGEEGRGGEREGRGRRERKGGSMHGREEQRRTHVHACTSSPSNATVQSALSRPAGA